MTIEHVPVMIDQVLEQFDSIDRFELLLDGTLGLGGYSEAILDRFQDVRVIGVDQDPYAIEIASSRLARFGDRFIPVMDNFSNISGIVGGLGFDHVDGIVFDLGISNMQITVPERGFSFRENGPLDMRMDGGRQDGISAGEMINQLSAPELSDIFRVYGEERHSWMIAKGIVRFREKFGPILDTFSLVEAIRSSLPAPAMRKAKGHPARKVFQALRIVVNGEMEALKEGLDGAIEVISPGGVIVVVGYHSLEDRIVKWKFREWKDETEGTIMTRKALLPSEEEVERNPKSRSAKLRAFMANIPM
ncbi:16S rRNA (cytosine(1402)-N(4))-methyltransferase RsmH [Dethiosulfovibrio salsuginis]|uniref:Ribosomal RNA small subunit methyltransferase H n=1 Tax=Dethiosulfovibrio salsuginis TaxID=561720 RepID=A0A1X7I7Z5_9BACT|nr:16S rRNA (cytosine(1402)-N(4))-methyltransferase RsmH [Dethiosulfovibrio salsuginis]SMG10018.1 16S rRNA (cytosine1402-N4)-methyltransferase [Dethiosulfovibrio salsuginis]